jgi:hypothetical protein
VCGFLLAFFLLFGLGNLAARIRAAIALGDIVLGFPAPKRPSAWACGFGVFMLLP